MAGSAYPKYIKWYNQVVMSDAKITIYGADWCPPCHMTKHYLDGKKIAYNYIDVDKDPSAAQKLVEKTGRSAIPVIEIGEKLIVGFDRPSLDEAIKEYKLA